MSPPAYRNKPIGEAVTLDTSKLVVRPATSIADLREVLRLRYRGYQCFSSFSSALDELDLSEHTTILIAEHDHNGIVGTLRLIDGAGTVELDHFIKIDAIAQLNDRSFIEATRFAIRACPDFEAAKMLLCKAHWLFALNHEKRNLLISSKLGLAKFYEYMSFSDIGPQGEYLHDVFRMARHRTYFLNASSALEKLRDSRNRYREFMADTTHRIVLE